MLSSRSLGRPVAVGRGVSRPSRLIVAAASSEAPRLRLHNLGPDLGSRHKEDRKGRGTSAGQGTTCGYGSKGQKARSGSGVRSGFEGGQTPIYRRLPKLRGIAGGMGAGLPDFVVVNLADLEKNFAAGAEVSLDSVREQVLSVSGRDNKLPLKILGSGSLSKALTVKAASFSETAKAAIEAAGGKAEVVQGKKPKWNRWRDAAARKANPNFAIDAKTVKVAKLLAKKAKKTVTVKS